MNERPTIKERYARSAETSDLTLSWKEVGSADVMMAAGMASQGSPDRMLALVIWRMLEGDTARFSECRDVLGEWLRHEITQRRMQDLGRHGARTVAGRTLFWFLNTKCLPCEGRGHPVIENTPVLDDTRNCQHCHGTGNTPLERVLQPQMIPAGRMLADHIDSLTSRVFGEMRKKLS